MRPIREIEYIPLDYLGKELPNKRGFLHRLLCRLIQSIGKRLMDAFASSSGEEVEEKIIEF